MVLYHQVHAPSGREFEDANQVAHLTSRNSGWTTEPTIITDEGRESSNSGEISGEEE